MSEPGKIIQIVGGVDCEGNQSLMGLDADGRIWEYVWAQQPYMVTKGYGENAVKSYVAGRTAGWQPMTDAVSRPIPHPEAPEEL